MKCLSKLYAYNLAMIRCERQSKDFEISVRKTAYSAPSSKTFVIFSMITSR